MEERCIHASFPETGDEPLKIYEITVDPEWDLSKAWACQECVESYLYRLSARGPLKVDRAKRF